MKIKFLLTTFLTLILSFVFSCSKGENTQYQNNKQNNESFDIYLLIGQSNMAGRGTMLPSDTSDFIQGVWLLDDQGRPVPAKNPLNQYSSVRKKLSMQQIGPGYAFSVKIAEKTGRKILLVVNARGGSRMSDWQPGAPATLSASEKAKIAQKISQTKAGTDNSGDLYLYDDAVARCKEAMQYGVLKGILWHQGESDAGDKDYLSKMAELAANLRRDLGVNAEDVPFIAGELAPWKYSAFNQRVFPDMTNTIPNSDYASSDCSGIINDGMLKDASDPHFNRDAQIRLGKRYANKILKMVYNIKDNEESTDIN